MYYNNEFSLYGIILEYSNNPNFALICNKKLLIDIIVKMFKFDNNWSVRDITYESTNIVKFSINSSIPFLGIDGYFLNNVESTLLCPGIFLKDLTTKSLEYYENEQRIVFASLSPVWFGLSLIAIPLIYIALFLCFISIRNCVKKCAIECAKCAKSSDLKSDLKGDLKSDSKGDSISTV